MLTVRIYQRPNGKWQDVEIKNVYPDDAEFFKKNNVAVSMESDGTEGNYICYADYGAKLEDGTPVDAIEFSLGKNCEDTLKALREQVEYSLGKQNGK